MATTKKNVTVEENVIETMETTVKAPVEKKAPAKKTAAKKAASKKAAEVKCEIAVQFAGKSYTQEDLMKIAKDVWVYDLNRTAEELVNVELYVKPEDSSVYYVFNGTETGSFLI